MRTEQVARVLKNYETFAEIDRDELDGWEAVALQKI
jgi:hypothetical protein